MEEEEPHLSLMTEAMVTWAPPSPEIDLRLLLQLAAQVPWGSFVRAHPDSAGATPHSQRELPVLLLL